MAEAASIAAALDELARGQGPVETYSHSTDDVLANRRAARRAKRGAARRDPAPPFTFKVWIPSILHGVLLGFSKTKD